MPRKLKVWGGLTSTAKVAAPNGSLEARTIVCATSQRKAVELLSATRRAGVSLYGFLNYWCETGNEQELALATTPGVWTSQENSFGRGAADWLLLTPKGGAPEKAATPGPKAQLTEQDDVQCPECGAWYPTEDHFPECAEYEDVS